MSDLDNLDKIDLLRERMDVNYEKAKAALESSGGDVVAALVDLERREKSQKEQFQVRGAELMDKIKALVRKGNVTRIRVKQGERVLLELPVTAGVVGTVFAPELTVIGAAAALAARCTVEVEREPGEPTVH